MSEESRFRAELVRIGQHITVIELYGEASVSAVPEFKQLLLSSIEDDTRTTIVDLTGASLADNAILGTLVAGAQPARSKSVHLDVICREQRIVRVFQITGLDRIFGVYASRDEALRAALRRQSYSACCSLTAR